MKVFLIHLPFISPKVYNNSIDNESIKAYVYLFNYNFPSVNFIWLRGVTINNPEVRDFSIEVAGREDF